MLNVTNTIWKVQELCDFILPSFLHNQRQGSRIHNVNFLRIPTIHVFNRVFLFIFHGNPIP